MTRIVLSTWGYAARAAEVAAVVKAERGTETACDAIEQVLGERAPGGARR